MKNFIFLSPNFPETYWRFCHFLKENGFNVLGIGDCPFENLTYELRSSLTEYYNVWNLENYDAVKGAVGYFQYKYGKIDFLESNNEYWLERDAYLRTDFNIDSGFKWQDVRGIKYKSEMKKFYEKAGVKVARYCMATDYDTCAKFIEEVGYPVIVKPDNGVGASDTHKLHNSGELSAFFWNKPPVDYIMEEFIDAEVNSYDAIINSKGEPVFESGNVTPRSLMDVVNNGDECLLYIVNEPFEDVKKLGRAVVAAYGVKSRFVHFEFFRLLSDQHIGKKGEVVALEVNMRPCGGIAPDMLNYANSTDVYKIWADVMAFDKTDLKCGEKFYCGFVGRRDWRNYHHTDDEISSMYHDHIKAFVRVAPALAGEMGDRLFIANFKTKKELEQFFLDGTKK